MEKMTKEFSLLNMSRVCLLWCSSKQKCRIHIISADYPNWSYDTGNDDPQHHNYKFISQKNESVKKKINKNKR